MSDFSAKRIGDMQAAYGGGFVKARAELGVTSFGMQVLQFRRTPTAIPSTTTPPTARRRSSRSSTGPDGS